MGEKKYLMQEFNRDKDTPNEAFDLIFYSMRFNHLSSNSFTV